MKTLREVYQEILEHPDRWFYYSGQLMNSQNRCFDKSIFTNKLNAYEFIRKYFERGGKSESLRFRLSPKQREHIRSRAKHIVSTFFLGIYIAECMEIKTTLRDEQNMDFRYYWFLICLYHDMGYGYELTHNCDLLKDIQEDGLAALLDIFNLTDVPDSVYQTYSKDDINRYLSYCATCTETKVGRLDHGIVGGLLLYQKLYELFERYRKRRNRSGTSNRNDFYINSGEHRLHLSTEHFKAYETIADAIIAHNIWASTLAECTNPNRKTTIVTLENPYLFVLSIADTLEPIKRERANERYLDNICIEAANQKIKLLASSNAYTAVYKTISNMQDWVDVHVQIAVHDENGYTEIIIERNHHGKENKKVGT